VPGPSLEGRSQARAGLFVPRLTAADLLNGRVLPFFEEHGIPLLGMLTDRSTEYCGSESHECELYLAVENIDHTRTKVMWRGFRTKWPPSCERRIVLRAGLVGRPCCKPPPADRLG
jgi:hypothetical protein